MKKRPSSFIVCEPLQGGQFSSSRRLHHPETLTVQSSLSLHDTNFYSNFHPTTQASIFLSKSSDVDVLSTQDIIVGTILAFILAFGYSYLNGQSSSTNFVLWGSQSSQITPLSNSTGVVSSSSTVFNETNWKEISKTENYILYNTRIRDMQALSTSKTKMVANRSDNSSDITNNNNSSRQNKVVFVALLALFLPIFCIEIFFALSRKFICEGGLFDGGFQGANIAERFCSPISLEIDGL